MLLAGAATGLVVGSGGTWLFLHQGGSTSLCGRSANQDAMRAGECLALTALGGAVGAGLGFLVGSRIQRDRREAAPLDRLRVGVVLGPRPGMVGLRLAGGLRPSDQGKMPRSS